VDASVATAQLDSSRAEAGEAAVAFSVNLHVGGRMWKYLMGYDQAFRGYGPGNMLFMKELEAVHARGVRAIEFGGEALDWKHGWTAEEEELLALEWHLGSWKGRLWSLARRSGVRADTAPMRSAADNEV
jgi:CelD/BcsL family acetyltransferase involved in cellulose biosynthesis